MRHISRLPIRLTAMLVITTLVKAKGQPNTDVFYCSSQFNRIQAVFNDTTHLSFQSVFYLTFNNSTRDTINFNYKVSSHKVWMWSSDSIEVLQNNFYNLVLYSKQKRAVISRPADVCKFLLHANITDVSFYNLFITGASVADSGSFRKLSYTFKTGSPYQQYDIIYDTATYRINSIRYRFNPDASNTTSQLPYCVNVLFSNYQTGGFTDSVFSTNPYFMRKQGIYYMVSPYTGYQLINSLNQ